MLLQIDPQGRRPHAPPPPAGQLSPPRSPPLDTRAREPPRPRLRTPGPRHIRLAPPPPSAWLSPGAIQPRPPFPTPATGFAGRARTPPGPADPFVGRHCPRRIDAAPSAQFNGRGLASPERPSTAFCPPLIRCRGGPEGANGGTNHQPQDIGAPGRPPPSPAIPFDGCSRQNGRPRGRGPAAFDLNGGWNLSR
jgi:hypothetical protein